MVSNYPPGAENDPRAPYNQPDATPAFDHAEEWHDLWECAEWALEELQNRVGPGESETLQAMSDMQDTLAEMSERGGDPDADA